MFVIGQIHKKIMYKQEKTAVEKINTTVKPEEIFVIIPTFNEGKVIAETIKPLLENKYTVVVIDDCSTDNTEQILKDYPIVYLKHLLNLGQGAALQTGIDYSLSKNAKFVITFDADGQHNFEEIPILLDPLLKGNSDISIGTRFKRVDDIRQIPKLRRIILKIAIVVNGLFTGMWLSDAHNGFRALNNHSLSKIKLKENRMAHASEILSQIRVGKLRYEEVPVNIVYTDYSKMKGQSSLNSINIFIDLILKNFF